MDINEMLASTASARAQMEFQERMSNTAIQRQVADMRAAGINPVLSAKLGGASTPEGASGDYSAVLNLLSDAISTNAQAVNALGSNARAMEDAIKSGLQAVLTKGKEAKELAEFDAERQAKLEDQTTTASQFKLLGFPVGEIFNAIARAGGYRNWSELAEDAFNYSMNQNKNVGRNLSSGLKRIVNSSRSLDKSSGKKTAIQAGLSSKY